ncbi:hypothetical protein DXG01_004206 [Tephrocybe rancida]|nr:hypothetical protein DXG01_004206 [Tephrocybe rancida]
MNNNSYPSPFSATSSPPVNNDVLPTVSATGSSTTEAEPRSNPTQSNANLQQASVALESAYHRIRQFRRSLLEVADSASSPRERRSSPSEAAYPSPNDNRRTFTLSSAQGPDTSDSEDDELYSARPYPRRPPGAISRPRDLPPLRTSVQTRNTPSSSNHPVIPHPPYPQVYRSQLDSRFSRRRESLADDASTSLGRRIAAREAAGATGSTPVSPAYSHFLSRYEGNSAQLLAALEREFEQFRQPSLPQSPPVRPRTEFTRTASTNAPVAPNGPRAADIRRQIITQNLQDLEASRANNSSLVPQPESLRRRLTGSIFPSRSSTMSTQSERLSLLSNLSSIQNLPTPLSATSSRPLIFEEPSSYVRAADFTNESRDSAWSTNYGEEADRSYVVRRRYNADGEEHVHPINLEWLDDAPMYTGPGAIRRSAQRGLPEASTRRRGWARLDADGNEIPSEEEEELERARAEYRRHAQSQRGPVQITDPGYHSLQAPTTSASLTPGDGEDDPMAGLMPRVRLGHLGSRDYHGSVMDSVMKVDLISVEQRAPVPVAPFRPNPLPTPIDDMIWTPPKRKHRVKGVAKTASFAGR